MLYHILILNALFYITLRFRVFVSHFENILTLKYLFRAADKCVNGIFQIGSSAIFGLEIGTHLSNHGEAERVTPTSAMELTLYLHPQTISGGGGASSLVIYSLRTIRGGQTTPVK